PAAWKEFRSQCRTINHIYSITSWVAIEFWQREAEQLLSRLFECNNITTNQDLILKTIYTPWKKTALIEMQDKLQKGIPSSQIIQDYQFLRSWAVVWYTPLEESWLASFMKPLVDPFPHLSKEKALALLNPSKEERKLLEMAPYIIFFKDWRDDVRRSAAYHWSFLSDALATYWNIPRDDIGYLTFDEIASALQNKIIPLEHINLRKTHPCIITSTEQKLHIIVKDFPLPEKYPSIIFPLETSTSPLIKGFIAYPGKVRGKVRIIHSYHDIKKIQQGEILVANTTHPTYVPGMHKAAAIVTNEGGIASHAAVVARELMKPCIVGTRIATKVLQDGDLVEVDADNGIVFKITTLK
ncbi:MAG: PEP-utilizing enzyme, partial [Nanoarchaeota archaeon]